MQLGAAVQAVHARGQCGVGVAVVGAGQEDGRSRLAWLAGGAACRWQVPEAVAGAGDILAMAWSATSVFARHPQQAWRMGQPTASGQPASGLAIPPASPAVGEVMFHSPRTNW